MKRLIFSVIIALSCLSTVSLAQSVNRTDADGRRQGKWNAYYQNGQLRYEGQFKDGRCHGEFKYYDEDGNLQATNEFDQTGEKALNKTYSPNGRMIATGYYLNQHKDGEWRYYSKDDGILLLVENNKDGQVDGWSKMYNPETGKLAEETFFVNGQREGECRKYYDTGILLMECQYHNNLLNGPAKVYYSNSSIKEEGSYVGGEKSGKWKTYNEDGDLVSTDEFGPAGQ